MARLSLAALACLALLTATAVAARRTGRALTQLPKPVYAATTRISLGLQQPFSLACATAGSDATLWMVSTGTTVFDEDEFSPGPPAQIRQYSADGRLLQAFGSFGEGPGQLKFPQSLAAVPAGSGLRIVVADAVYGNPHVSEFDGATGALIASWKLPDGSAPIALAAHGARFLYVVHGRVDDTWSLFPSRLSKLDLEDRAADGTPALVWSVDVGSVGGLGVDGDGNVWVTRAKSITQHAASDGTTLWTVDVSSSLGFNTVVDVRVDENGWLYLLTSGWSTTGSVLVMHQYGPTFVQIGKLGDAPSQVRLSTAFAVASSGELVWTLEPGSSTATLWKRTASLGAGPPRPCTRRDPACAECNVRDPLKCALCTDPAWVVDRRTGRCRAPRCTDLDPACARCQWQSPLRCAACKRYGWVVVNGQCKPSCLLSVRGCARCDRQTNACAACRWPYQLDRRSGTCKRRYYS